MWQEVPQDGPGVPAAGAGQLCGPLQPGGGEELPAPPCPSLHPGTYAYLLSYLFTHYVAEGTGRNRVWLYFFSKKSIKIKINC